MSSSKWLYPFLITALLSCQSQEKDTQKTKKTNSENISQAQSEDEVSLDFKVKVSQKTELKKDFTNFEEFKKDINKFKVDFKAISGKFSGVDVECRKDLFDRDRIEFKTKFDKLGTVATIDLSIDEKNPGLVSFNCRFLDRGIEVAKETIKLKKSFVISGIQNIYTAGLGFEDIETLVLDEGSILVTEGMTVTLNVKNLVSKNAKIITFSEEEALKTITNRDGASGLLININAENAVGKLNVELRGTDGAPQIIIPADNTDIPLRDPRLDGTCNGETFEADYDGSIDKPYRCFGKNGFSGNKGFPGLKGFNGGATGRFILKIKSECLLNLSINYFPGNGGKGGKGGLGSKGGPGGIGSTVSLRYPKPDTQGCAACKTMNRAKTYKFADGQVGPTGLTGDQGAKGLDGESETSIIELTKQNEFFEINSNWQNF